MPLYEYQCNACEKRFEELQRMSDAPLATCRECGGELRKLLSSPAFQFKGTGWYVTDYSKSGSSQNDSNEPSKESEANNESVSEASSSEGSKESSKEASKVSSVKSSEGQSAKAAS